MSSETTSAPPATQPPQTGGTNRKGASYEHPIGFWLGITTTTAGVIVQLPMYWMARHDHFHVAGMPLTPEMWLGMVMMIVGVTLTGWALLPAKAAVGKASKIKIAALDDVKINKAHVLLLLVLTAALTIDGIKPAAFAFLAPGASAEYGLRNPLNPTADGWSITLYPLSGITGTMIGSFVWGWLGDRIGRRAAILLAAVIFIATSTCGTMPQYWMNLVTCFIMGWGAGGMLPITFALLSEAIPKRHRGWMMVIMGSTISVAYLILSWLSATLASPDRYGWRLLFLIGLPTGLFLLLLNRWIPESPRFLLQHGREEEARAVMQRYGATITTADDASESDLSVERHLKGSFGQLFRGNFLMLSVAVLLLGLSVGMTQYGFQQWMPSNLQKLGFSSVHAASILRNAALIGLPFSIPVAALYGFWSTKKTLVIITGLLGTSLTAFSLLGDRVADNQTLLYVLLVIPIWGIGILNGVLAAYTAEIYPTVIRARGSGLSAGATKAGGVGILILVVAAVAAPSVRITAILGLLPMALALVVLVLFGPETRHRQLESITAEELHLDKDPARTI